MSDVRLPISFVVLSYNEELNIGACLESVVGWVEEIVVVDSGSTDATLAIAQKHGATIVHHPFESHGEQWTWALENLPLHCEWLLGLDADQQVTADLKNEMFRLFAEDGVAVANIDGCYLNRRQVFRGSWIRYGGYYPKYLLKLFRRSKVRIDKNDLMDHHFYVAGKVLTLKGDIIESNQKENDISFWIEKHNRYAVLHAQEELFRRIDSRAWPIKADLFGSHDQRIVWLKQQWYRLPLYVRPVLYFLIRYFLQLGFLDGKQGFIFHLLQGFWYRLLIDIHLDDLLNQHSGSG